MLTLDKERIREIIPESICFFLYAEGGAMGSPGSVEFIIDSDKGLTHYIAYYLPFVPGHIGNEDISYLFPSIDDIDLEMFGGCTGLPDEWYYVNLGAGNHLFVRSEYYRSFMGRVSDCNHPSEIYSRWSKEAFIVLTDKDSGNET